MNPRISRADILRIIAHTLEHGGGTFDIHGNFGPRAGVFAPPEGYAVSLRGGHKFVLNIVEHDDLKDIVAAAEKAINAVTDALLGNSAVLFIGTWIDDRSWLDDKAEGPTFYVDPVVFLGSRMEALLLASHEGQKAFYDFAAKDSIFVEPSDAT